jgi:predicted DNA-binding protein
MRKRRRDTPHPTSIRLPRELRKRLEARAEQHGAYLSVYIIWLLQQDMNRLDGHAVVQPLPQFPQQES